MNPKFTLGQLVATPGALAAVEKSGDNLALYIRRHVQGDWGELCADDVQEMSSAWLTGCGSCRHTD
jgi:hypothetical protein